MLKMNSKTDFLKYDYLSLGIIKSDLNTVKSDLFKLYEINDNHHNWKISKSELSLNQIVSSSIIPKGGSHYPKFVIWSPKNIKGFIAFFSNYQDGLSTTKYNIAKRYNRTVIDVTFSNNKLTEFPSYYFNYYGENDYERTVYSMKDSRSWEFYEKGEPLEIENQNYYKNRIKNKKINNEIILEYLAKMEIFIDEHFFESSEEAIYFERLKW